MRDFVLAFLFSSLFIFLPIEMYCLNCRRVTETENIATATSRNGRLMMRGQCITCGKTMIQCAKKGANGGSFLTTLANKLPFEMHLPGHNFTGQGTNSIKD